MKTYMKWKTCYICYIVDVEYFTVLHFVLHNVTTVTLTITVFVTAPAFAMLRRGKRAQRRKAPLISPRLQSPAIYVKEQKATWLLHFIKNAPVILAHRQENLKFATTSKGKNLNVRSSRWGGHANDLPCCRTTHVFK